MSGITKCAIGFCDEHYENLSRALRRQLMAVKTLKLVFREFFLTLTKHKPIFVNSMSVSVMTGPHSFFYCNQY